MEIELVGVVANLGTLTLAGILYMAYIRNLRSQLNLKDEQIKVADQNLMLWKDKALELERQSPQFVEKQLSERILIREEEIARLAKDGEKYRTEIDQKRGEVEKYKKELEAAQEFGRAISIYDRDTGEFRQVRPTELQLKDIGQVWVDSATLLITDPFHLGLTRNREKADYPLLDYRFSDPDTGEIFCTNDDSDELVDPDTMEPVSIRRLVELGRLEELEPAKKLPADPNTYVKGKKLAFTRVGAVQNCTFYNGLLGAGLAIGTKGDGYHHVRAEMYRGSIERIIIDM